MKPMPSSDRYSGQGMSPFAWQRVAATILVVFLMVGGTQEYLSRSGLRWVYLLALSLGLCYVCTPLIWHLAHRIGALDIPSGRKAHLAPTALLGGVSLYVAVSLCLLRNFTFSLELKGVALAGTLILIIGIIDDLRGLPASVKLLGQVAATAILIRCGVVISFLPETLWGHLGEWVLTAVWVIGITNAVNFLDGMDGLAAGTSGINALFFSLVALQNQQYYMSFLAVPLVGACIGFLAYNFRRGRPAAVFLGDAGSTFLGFVLASLGVMGDWAGDHTVRLMVPILILGVPIFDMTFTTIMRVKTGAVRSIGEWLEYTGRDHIHHRLEDLRVGRAGAVLVVYALTVWLGLSALALKNATGVSAILQAAQSALVFTLLAFFMVFVRRQYSEIEVSAVIAGLDPDGGMAPPAEIDTSGEASPPDQASG